MADQLMVNQENRVIMTGKKIAIFMQSLAIGGAERVTLNLAKGLVQQGMYVDLLLANRSGGLLSEVSPQITIVD